MNLDEQHWQKIDKPLECPECYGKTVLFKGQGLDAQYYVCSRWQQPGHLSEAEIRDVIRQRAKTELPSGRWA